MDYGLNQAMPETSGEIETRRFEYRGRRVYCEKFLRIDWNLQDPMRDSELLNEVNDAMTSWDASHPEPSEKAVQYTAASVFARRANKNRWKDPQLRVEEAYEELHDSGRDTWPEAEESFDKILQEKLTNARTGNRYCLQRVLEKWKRWKCPNKCRINERNAEISTRDELLRAPPNDEIYLALDRNDFIVAFLDPQGIQQAFGEGVLERMIADSELFYSLKYPSKKSNKRHASRNQFLRHNPHLDPQKCGSDHYGNWHAQAHSGCMVESADVTACGSMERQLLLQFLHYTGGSMTRVIDYWFGVWDSQQREEYRRVYRESDRFSRLPPTNDGHDETYCLRVVVCNRPTDEHSDAHDWRKGLTGLCQIGRFTGAAMCFNQLRLRLDGYNSGAVLLIRGGELDHYLSPWNGECRYAFDHTTHETVREAVLGPIRVEQSVGERRKKRKYAKKGDKEGEEGGEGPSAKKARATRTSPRAQKAAPTEASTKKSATKKTATTTLEPREAPPTEAPPSQAPLRCSCKALASLCSTRNCGCVKASVECNDACHGPKGSTLDLGDCSNKTH